MHFTLAVSAASAARCAELTRAACAADPRVMPLPGPPAVAWRADDGRAALVRWPAPQPDPTPRGAGPAASRAGTIRADSGAVIACTSITRVDPVYVAELGSAVIVSDRATWAAAVAGRLADFDPGHVCALLNPGFPLGVGTPFRGVRALGGARTVRLNAGQAHYGTAEGDGPVTDLDHPDAAKANPGRSAGTRPGLAGMAAAPPGTASAVAQALVAAVEPLRCAGQPVELSLTGGKDSRLVAAALVAAGVTVRAKTHGFAGHPDVRVAAQIAGQLGIEHVVTTPPAPGTRVDPLSRIRATVLVADGMLSAFENTGRPDPAASAAVTAGGHGGELLRGGYAEVAAARGNPAGARAARALALRAGGTFALHTAGAAVLLRRLTSRHIGLLRRGPATGYLAGLAPWTAALARGPLHALDDFYLVNRAGRWSAAARQAYLLRENLSQPLFDGGVVRAARAVPLDQRVSGDLTGAVLTQLNPGIAGIPYAGKAAGGKSFDWRRDYGTEIAGFFREYVLDCGALFDVVRRAEAERVLAFPAGDPGTVWALATLACLHSGDWLAARDPSPRTSSVGALRLRIRGG